MAARKSSTKYTNPIVLVRRKHVLDGLKEAKAALTSVQGQLEGEPADADWMDLEEAAIQLRLMAERLNAWAAAHSQWEIGGKQ